MDYNFGLIYTILFGCLFLNFAVRYHSLFIPCPITPSSGSGSGRRQLPCCPIIPSTPPGRRKAGPGVTPTGSRPITGSRKAGPSTPPGRRKLPAAAAASGPHKSLPTTPNTTSSIPKNEIAPPLLLPKPAYLIGTRVYYYEIGILNNKTINPKKRSCTCHIIITHHMFGFGGNLTTSVSKFF